MRTVYLFFLIFFFFFFFFGGGGGGGGLLRPAKGTPRVASMATRTVLFFSLFYTSFSYVCVVG